MNIHIQKLGLIEQLLKVDNESLILKIKALLDFAETEQENGTLTPMSLSKFYQKLLESEEAIQNGDVISQEKLWKKAKTWKST